MHGWVLPQVRGATLLYAMAAFLSALSTAYFALGLYSLSILPTKETLFGLPIEPGHAALVGLAVLAALAAAGLLTAFRASGRLAPASLAVAASFLLFALDLAGYQQHHLAGRISLGTTIVAALPSLGLLLWTSIAAERNVRIFSRASDWVDRAALALWNRKLLGRSLVFWLIAAVGIAVTISFISVTLNQYWNIRPRFDTARFENDLWHTLRGRIGWESIDRVNHLGVHFSPTLLLLLLPVYALYQHATTLLVAESLLLVAAAIPLWLLARRITGSTRAAYAFTVAYLFFPHVIGINIHGFSDFALWPVFGFTYLLLLERPRIFRNPGYWLFLVLVLGVKEEIAVTLAALSAAEWLQGRNRLGHSVTIAVCTLWFVAVTQAVMPALLGPAGHPGLGKGWLYAYYYSDLLPEGSRSFFELLANVFLHPLLLAQALARPQVLKFISDISVPLLFLPVLSGLRLISLVPNLLLVNLITAWRPLSSTLSVYIAYLVPWFYCALHGWVRVKEVFPRLSETARKGLLYLMMLLAVLLLTQNVRVARSIPRQTAELRHWLEARPADLRIMASNCFLPLMSNRDEIRNMNADEDLTQINLVIVQSGQNYCTWAVDPYEDVRAAVLDTHDFVEDPSAEDGIVVFRRVRAPGAPHPPAKAPRHPPRHPENPPFSKLLAPTGPVVPPNRRVPGY